MIKAFFADLYAFCSVRLTYVSLCMMNFKYLFVHQPAAYLYHRGFRYCKIYTIISRSATF